MLFMKKKIVAKMHYVEAMNITSLLEQKADVKKKFIIIIVIKAIIKVSEKERVRSTFDAKTVRVIFFFTDEFNERKN